MFIWRHTVLYIIPTVCICKKRCQRASKRLGRTDASATFTDGIEKELKEIPLNKVYLKTHVMMDSKITQNVRLGGVLSGWTKETFVEWSCFFWSYPLWNILVNLNAFNNNRLFQNVSFLNTYQEYWIQTFRFYRKTFCVTCLATEAGSLYLPRVAVAYWFYLRATLPTNRRRLEMCQNMRYQRLSII